MYVLYRYSYLDIYYISSIQVLWLQGRLSRPPQKCVFSWLRPIFIGIPCVNTMFTSPIVLPVAQLARTQHQDKRPCVRGGSGCYCRAPTRWTTRGSKTATPKTSQGCTVHLYTPSRYNPLKVYCLRHIAYQRYRAHIWVIGCIPRVQCVD